MIDAAITYLTETDSYAAIEYLNRQSEPLDVVNTYADVVLKLYWEAKNLPAVVAMARAGIQYGLTVAAASADPKITGAIKSVAKGIAYNLASFTWPGWDEPDITISSSDLAVGLDAAKANLRLAGELDKGDLPLSRAYWMLGAHHLAGHNLNSAGSCFNNAQSHAARASAEADRMLAQAFSLITTLLADPNSSDLHSRLSRAKGDLAQLDHGEQFVDQVDTALRIFSEQTSR